MTKLFLKELSKIHPKNSKEYKQILDEYISDMTMIMWLHIQKAPSPTQREKTSKLISELNTKYSDKYKLNCAR